MKNFIAKLQAAATIKAIDAKEGVKNFVTSEVSAKGTMEEGVNSYGVVVLGVIVIALAVIAYKAGFLNIFDGFQKGTTKRPADWV